MSGMKPVLGELGKWIKTCPLSEKMNWIFFRRPEGDIGRHVKIPEQMTLEALDLQSPVAGEVPPRHIGKVQAFCRAIKHRELLGREKPGLPFPDLGKESRKILLCNIDRA